MKSLKAWFRDPGRREKLPVKVTYDRGTEWGWVSATGDGDAEGFREQQGVVRLGRCRQAAQA